VAPNPGVSRFGPERPLCRRPGGPDDVVLRPHGIDVTTRIKAQIPGMVDQHAGAADGDDVVGGELVPTGAGGAHHGGSVAMPDHGVNGWCPDVGGALPGLERVQTAPARPRQIGEVGVVEAHRAVIAHPRRHRHILRPETPIGL
jgi:hypothetical protein